MNKIGRIELFCIALGSVVGWGAFILPGSFFLINAGVINTLVGFFIAIVMIAVIEKNYSALMEKYNSGGGEYTFAKEEFGDVVGFYTGWLLLLAYVSIIPLNATAIPMVFEKILPFYSKGILLYSVASFPVYLNDLLTSLSFIIIFSYIQLKGIGYSARMQNIAVFLLLVSVVLLFIFSFVMSTPLHDKNLESNLGVLDMNSIIRIIAFAPWAFIGFDTVAQVTSESKVKPKTASLMAFIAVLFGGGVYNALNIVTAFGINHSELNSEGWATGDSVMNLMGPAALLVVGLAMLGAVLSGLNGFFMSSTRLTLAMVPSKYKNRIDLRSIILFVTITALFVPFFGRNALFWFVDVSSVGASFAYFVTSLAAIKLSRNLLSRTIGLLGCFCSFMFLIFLLTPFFKSNIPIVSAIVLAFWIGIGLLMFKFFYISKRSVRKM